MINLTTPAEATMQKIFATSSFENYMLGMTEHCSKYNTKDPDEAMLPLLAHMMQSAARGDRNIFIMISNLAKPDALEDLVDNDDVNIFTTSHIGFRNKIIVGYLRDGLIPIVLASSEFALPEPKSKPLAVNL